MQQASLDCQYAAVRTLQQAGLRFLASRRRRRRRLVVNEPGPYWPGRSCRVWLPSLLLAAAVAVGALLHLMVSVSLVWIVSCVMRCSVRKRSFQRPPSSIRVAVIGGGWSGCAVVARLQELGVQHLDAFDQLDNIGGTWHRCRRYAGLKLHTSAHGASFANFPFAPTRAGRDSRPTSEEFSAYMRRFAAWHGLEQRYSFSTATLHAATLHAATFHAATVHAATVHAATVHLTNLAPRSCP